MREVGGGELAQGISDDMQRWWTKGVERGKGNLEDALETNIKLADDIAVAPKQSEERECNKAGTCTGDACGVVRPMHCTKRII